MTDKIKLMNRNAFNKTYRYKCVTNISACFLSEKIMITSGPEI